MKKETSKPPKTGNARLQIDIPNYLDDRIREILSTGDFLNIDDFMMSAVGYFIAQYETRCVSKKKKHENVTRQLYNKAKAEDNTDLVNFLRPYLEPETNAEIEQEDVSKYNEWCEFLAPAELKKYL
jgi:Arc/MetJ-type ribon-helix-helix transcriptional regulator